MLAIRSALLQEDSMAVEVFISYAHKDRKFRDVLAIHLSNLRNLGVISDWYDGDIPPGTEWKPQIMGHLQTAQIILLLISADFMASKFCYSIELQEAIARHDAKQVRVIPIILRPTDWQSNDKFNKYSSTTRTVERVEIISAEKAHVFVAMPFMKEMDDVFYYGIQQPVHSAGFLCERVDQDAFTGDILDRVKKKIETAVLVIE